MQADNYMKPVADPHSFAQPRVAQVTHLNLNLTVNFDQQTLSGWANYTINSAPGATEIVLDVRDLIIKKVTRDNQEECPYALGEPHAYLGQPLTIPLLPQTRQVNIFYQTTARAAALQWLTPAQTRGKKHPFLFTQSQAILARTWLPCQDSPGIRFTYEASITVPPPFLALMSAANPQNSNPEGVYNFRQNRPIPAYLMALAVGQLTFKALDNRTGVYAEPESLPAAYQEFAELPEMVKAAENLYGPYLWDRYDLLVLPPSFPFGGMENPMLTFVTPTIIAGDRSLTSLVAHELAHSWSGNLVTNATWNDFWLNEGFTVYFERRIMEALHGADYANMLKVLGYQDLAATLAELGPDSPDTHLKLNLAHRDPDEGLTEIAYEKGNYFLLALEAAYGREVFDKFIRDYFKQHAFQAIDTENFLEFLKTHLLNQPANHQPKVQPELWIYGPGLPAERPALVSERFRAVAEQTARYQNTFNPADLNTHHWSTHEWLYFLHLCAPVLNEARMHQLDEIFHFSASGNAEILSVWLNFAIVHQYQPAYPMLENFLTTVGRRKYLTPLYKKLKNTDAAWATELYQRARPQYHAVTTRTLDQLLIT